MTDQECSVSCSPFTAMKPRQSDCTHASSNMPPVLSDADAAHLVGVGAGRVQRGWCSVDELGAGICEELLVLLVGTPPSHARHLLTIPACWHMLGPCRTGCTRLRQYPWSTKSVRPIGQWTKRQQAGDERENGTRPYKRRPGAKEADAARVSQLRSTVCCCLCAVGGENNCRRQKPATGGKLPCSWVFDALVQAVLHRWAQRSHQG